MAVGDGGFKQVAFGFDKNEVNTYISDLRKKMKSMEEDMKANDKKTEEAVKLAEEADERIKAAVKEGEDNAAKLEKQLSDEQKKNEDLEAQLKKIKSELESERAKMSDMLLSGKGVSAEANKAYTEIINKANADAKVIVDDANAKADEIVAGAKANSAVISEKADEFLAMFKEQIAAFTDGYNTISASAADILGTQAQVVAAPVFEAAPKASEAAVAATVAVEETVSDIVIEPEPAAVEETAEEEVVTEITASTDVMEVKADDSAMPAIEDAGSGDELASFDDVWGGNELAQTIYNNEKKDAVPLVNPEAKNLFGQDLFTPTENEMSDLNDMFAAPAEEEESVSEVAPLDTSDISKASFDNNFDTDLLSQTMPSGTLGDVNDDLLKAVQEAEAAFAVQANNIADLDMDEHEEESAADDENDLMKALREAEAALNNMVPPSDDAVEDTVADAVADAGDPWADLQKQFEAMEQSGNFSGAEEPAAETNNEAPATPSADDSSIWDFGGGSSNESDDDMSSDMFGGFGGF